jgi:hypothetical protein
MVNKKCAPKVTLPNIGTVSLTAPSGARCLSRTDALSSDFLLPEDFFGSRRIPNSTLPSKRLRTRRGHHAAVVVRVYVGARKKLEWAENLMTIKAVFRHATVRPCANRMLTTSGLARPNQSLDSID